MKRVKDDNTGFSLVEVLVTIAILAIVSTSVFEFVMVAIRHYQKESREVELQYEAQLTMNQLQDMVIDAKKGVSYVYFTGAVGDTGTIIFSDAEIAGTAKRKQLVVYDTDIYYVIEWNSDSNKLLYYEYNRDGVLQTSAAGELMAEFVSEFSVDLTFFNRNNGIGLNLLFENDREYRVMQNVKLRNQVSVNATRATIYGS